MDRVDRAYAYGKTRSWGPLDLDDCPSPWLWLQDQKNMRKSFMREEEKRLEWLIESRQKFIDLGLEKAAYKIEREIRESLL